MFELKMLDCLGEHTEEVLREYLLLSSEEIENLKKERII
jgi:crotonobetainyl-CoA:carnitine CoA-transferase CaiB-like acyl-CoA transferase